MADIQAEAQQTAATPLSQPTQPRHQPLSLALLRPDATGDGVRLSTGSRALLIAVAGSPGQSTTRERLASRLWPDTPWAIARRRLNSALHRVRCELEDDGFAERVCSIDDRVLLAVHPDDRVDLLELDAAYERCIAAAALTNTDRARFRALNAEADDYVLPTGDDQWAMLFRTRIENRVVAIRTRLAADALACDEPHLALHYCEQTLAVDPLREELHRNAIRAHLAMNDRAAALRRLEQLKLLLANELDASPMPETIRLLIPETLAADAGRANDAAHLRRALADVRTQLVGLLGSVDDALGSLHDT